MWLQEPILDESQYSDQFGFCVTQRGEKCSLMLLLDLDSGL